MDLKPPRIKVEIQEVHSVLCEHCAKKLDYHKYWKKSDTAIVMDWADKHDNCESCGKNGRKVKLKAVDFVKEIHHISRKNKMLFINEQN